MLQVTFAEAARLLVNLGSPVPPAEGHGCLCGALCVSADYSFERWCEELTEEELAPEDEQALRLLFSDTRAALDDDDSDFEPMLPDDDVALEQRTGALAQWAAGFLYGFGTAQPPRPAAPANATVDEVLADFARISAAGLAEDADPEEQEQAYAELVEYVRAGVWLLYAELARARDSHQPPLTDDTDDSPSHA